MMKVLGPLMGIGYFAVGLMQMAAVIGGIHVWLGLSTFLSIFLSFFVTYIPFAGTVLCYVGATQSFGWPPLWAAVFTMPGLIFALVAVVGALGFGAAEGRRR